MKSAHIKLSHATTNLKSQHLLDMDFLTPILSLEYDGSCSTIIVTAIISFLVAYFFLHLWHDHNKKQPLINIPPGTSGLPLIGETLQFLHHKKENTQAQFLIKRASKYGRIFTTSLFGFRTIVDTTGPSTHQFLFANENNLIKAIWPKPIVKILGGDASQSDDDHECRRAALLMFLKRDTVQKFVSRVDREIKRYLDDHFQGKKEITVYPLMRRFAFTLSCCLFLSIEDEGYRDKLFDLFRTAIRGLISVPINFPGTRYYKALRARRALDLEFESLLRKRKHDMKQGIASPHEDLLSYLLLAKDEEGESILSEQMIKDSIFLVISAAHDTMAATLTLLFMFLGQYRTCLDSVIKEQDEVAALKQAEQELNWEDLQNMQCTWRAIQETMRLQPPVGFSMREAVKDFELGGYTIPKGTKMFWSPYITHWNSEFFPQPLKFDPSRFEGKGPAPFTFVPFGVGPRSCPGDEFAKMVILAFVHRLVRQYRWELAIPDERITNDPTPRPAKGLPVSLEAVG